MHLQILKCPFLSFISGTHLGLIFKKGFSSSFLSSSSFTVCVDSPICKYPRSGSPPSLPAHQPRQDHGYERTRANVRDITHHFIKKKLKKKHVLPSIFVFDGWRLLPLYLMKQRSEDSPGFPQLITLMK